MNISPGFFYVFAGTSILFSLLVILNRSAIASAFSLLVVFFSFAGIYALLDAHLVAALQVLIYAGAILVLFIFVIMLLNVEQASFDYKRGRVLTGVFAAFGAFGMVFLLGRVFRSASAPAQPGPFSPENVQAAGGNTQVLSELLFSEYVLPFELTSVLLLAAIVGSVAIAKRGAVEKKSKEAK
ncbi:MAG TPA: NADH-quinone oxidoreductase subunit J [Bdellovibrionota bacterium]|nr:NADH-quinone oxidoreductase subunit J [Bdellovibrionota bacterium]